jgi:hypothetical protein
MGFRPYTAMQEITIELGSRLSSLFCQMLNKHAVKVIASNETGELE